MHLAAFFSIPLFITAVLTMALPRPEPNCPADDALPAYLKNVKWEVADPANGDTSIVIPSKCMCPGFWAAKNYNAQLAAATQCKYSTCVWNQSCSREHECAYKKPKILAYLVLGLNTGQAYRAAGQAAGEPAADGP